MAFTEFADAAPAALPIAHSALFSVNRPTPARLSQDVAELQAPLTVLEQRVVMLARQDGAETLRPMRKRSWLARLIFGATPPSPVLANARLEALRHLAVHAWHDGYTLPASSLRAARDAGYDETQIAAVVDLVGRSRPAVRRLAA